MKRLKTILFLSFCIGLTVNAQGDFTKLNDNQIAEFKTKLSTVSKDINTLTCSFTQVQSMSLLADEVSSKGTMTYQNPYKLAWVYTEPTEQAFIITMSTITTKNGKTRTTIDSGSSQMMQEMCKIIIAGLKGDIESLEKSFITAYLSDNKIYKLEMQPRNKAMARMFNTMILLFDVNTCLVTEIILSEPTGDTSTIYISDVKLNTNVDAAFEE